MQQLFLDEALKLAAQAVRDGVGGPFGAVVVRQDTIVGRGMNRVTSVNDPTAHAEIVAIRDACRELGSFRLAGCELYTSCEPCPMCLGAVYWSRLDLVYYAAAHDQATEAGFDDSWIYHEFRQPADRRKVPLTRVDHAEALAPFDLWKLSEKKVPY